MSETSETSRRHRHGMRRIHAQFRSRVGRHGFGWTEERGRRSREQDKK